MQAAKLIETRSPHWRQLEQLCYQMESRQTEKKLGARRRVEFAAMYRAACADLALADAYQLPADTVRYLHQLVGRAHNQLYRTHKLESSGWTDLIFRKVPRQLFHDNALRLAALLFWGPFLASMFLASNYTPVPKYTETVMGEDYMLMMEQMHSEPPGSGGPVQGGAGAGFYIHHNATIGIRCFVMGLGFGIGGMFETFFNAVILGAAFGHMTTVPKSEYFFEFVTAHGPFELTAIVLSAAAGMRMGFSLVSTGGLSRKESLLKAAKESVPTMFGGVLLFVLAAFIEGFLSPSAAPYELKALVAMLSTLALLAYLVVLGYSQHDEEGEALPAAIEATRPPAAQPTSPFDDPASRDLTGPGAVAT
ncbi:MAG: stage II sporulation protein M [Planctomycetota bacterium]